MMGVPVQEQEAQTPLAPMPATTNASPATTTAGTPGDGAPGLAVGRVKRIINEEKDLKPVADEAVFVVTKATEMFIEALAAKTAEGMHTGKGITYTEVSRAVQRWGACDFLHDIVPPKRTAAEIVVLMKKAQEQVDKE